MLSTQCNVSATAAEAEQGCVQLRVRAERSGLRSQHIEACSQYGESTEPPPRGGAQLTCTHLLVKWSGFNLKVAGNNNNIIIIDINIQRTKDPHIEELKSHFQTKRRPISQLIDYQFIFLLLFIIQIYVQAENLYFHRSAFFLIGRKHSANR